MLLPLRRGFLLRGRLPSPLLSTKTERSMESTDVSSTAWLFGPHVAHDFARNTSLVHSGLFGGQQPTCRSHYKTKTAILFSRRQLKFFWRPYEILRASCTPCSTRNSITSDKRGISPLPIITEENHVFSAETEPIINMNNTRFPQLCE